ncbi:BPSL0761 family protein [Paraburkholderia aspalathi]|uniref:Uncharacterized protein n=1 Tax=Paraburkholderia aspalathi TaxID=1324617 RepID=A0A1I7C7W9_9BURK|nr:BPSL0761 family protein [Paraburkholderia aspalathi]SFT95526.1 hypothetical protein SAMN05192563_10063 [Paraburkholderia aspalathi]
MTTANERTNAVIATRAFLETLAASHRDAGDEVRAAATRLVRHYPLNVDIAASAAALPGIWADPVARRH